MLIIFNILLYSVLVKKKKKNQNIKQFFEVFLSGLNFQFLINYKSNFYYIEDFTIYELIVEFMVLMDIFSNYLLGCQEISLT